MHTHIPYPWSDCTRPPFHLVHNIAETALSVDSIQLFKQIKSTVSRVFASPPLALASSFYHVPLLFRYTRSFLWLCSPMVRGIWLRITFVPIPYLTGPTRAQEHWDLREYPLQMPFFYFLLFFQLYPEPHFPPLTYFPHPRKLSVALSFLHSSISLFSLSASLIAHSFSSYTYTPPTPSFLPYNTYGDITPNNPNLLPSSNILPSHLSPLHNHQSQDNPTLTATDTMVESPERGRSVGRDYGVPGSVCGGGVTSL